MSGNITVDTPITSSAEFEAALATVVESAIDQGVDVRGAWEFETAGSTHHWELLLLELARRTDDEDTDSY